MKQVFVENQLIETVGRFSKLLLEVASVDEMFQHVAKTLIDSLGAQYCGISSVDEEGLFPVKRKSFGSPVEAFKNERNEDLVERISEDLLPESPLFFKKKDNQCRLIVTLLTNHKLWGFLIVDWLDDGKESSIYKELAYTLSSILVLTIEKQLVVKQFGRTIERLTYSEKVQSSLFAISELAHSSEDLVEFYRGLHGIIGQLMCCDNFFIAIIDDEKNLIHFPYFVDTVDNIDPNEYFSEELIKRSIAGYIIKEKRALLANKSELQKLHRKGDLDLVGSAPVSWLGVPFFSDRRLSGAIVVQSYDEDIKFCNRDKELLNYVSQHIAEVLRRKLDEENLQHRAMHDALTGLPNRHLMLDRLEHALCQLERVNQSHVVVLFLDLDHFKTINDTMGHLTGDDLLKKASRNIEKCLRKCDTLARIGGDEFAIVVDSLPDIKQAEILAKRIIQSLEKPKIIGENKISISTSIGISSTQDPHQTAQELLRQADDAMYKAKSSGRGRYCVYEENMGKSILGIEDLGQSLNIAMENGQFEMHYQPIISINSGKVHGFESLVRWVHPEKGRINPNAFIPQAEKSDLILKIDWHVLELVARQLQDWSSKYTLSDELSVSVNISGKQLLSKAFPSQLKKLLDRYQLPASLLKLEIAENDLVENSGAIVKVIKELNTMGVHLMLDDFGAGYTSLNHLHELCMDTVKIDRSLIGNMNSKTENNHVIKSIFALADAMEMKVIVEGVEQSWQMACLKQMGGKYAQGFLVSIPVTTKEVDHILSRKTDYSNLTGLIE